MAVAMHYGPPEGVDLLKPRPVNEITEDSVSHSFHHTSEVTAGLTKRPSKDSEQDKEVDIAERHEEIEADGEETANSADYSDGNDITDRPIYMSYDATNDADTSTAIEADETGQPLSRLSSFAELTELGIAWVDKMKQDIQNNNKKKMRSDPQEGILHLDKPLLLCQEIYDKLIGNHQTSRISKDRAIEYLRQDIEQHINDTEFDPFLAGQDEIVAQLESVKKAEDVAAARTRGKTSSSNTPVEEKRKETDLEAELKTGDKNPEAKSKGGEAEPTNNLQPTTPIEVKEAAEENLEAAGTIQQLEQFASKIELHVEEALPEDIQPCQARPDHPVDQHTSQTDVTSSPSSPATKDDNVNVGEDLAALEQESLIGYWNWQNTWKIHQVKMYLAQGSDLALHVCLAIIANQVRYERNAIALTV
jgi:hypothetical protein